MLKTTIEAAVAMGAVKKTEFERVIVDSTVQSKAIAHPTDSRLLEVAREKIARLAKRVGIQLKQTHELKGRTLRRRAGGYSHAKQFKRLCGVLKRQRPFLSRLLREVRCKMDGMADEARTQLDTWPQRAERIHRQRHKDKNKHGLTVGVRSFPGNPYDGHTLAAQIEQTNTLLQGIGVKPTTAIVDLGYRGVDKELAPVEAIHCGKFKSLKPKQRTWLKRRQAIEPLIGHSKADQRMARCWRKGAEGVALHAMLCAAGFNIRWLLRAIARLGLPGPSLALFALAMYAGNSVRTLNYRAFEPTP